MKHESIKNQCWWHQSTSNGRSHSNYCEQHQNQCAEDLQAIHKASTTIERKINISALASISMLRVSIASFQSINNQFALYQQPMCSASTANAHSTRIPHARFLQHEDFHSLQYASHSCHSARSRRRSRRIHPPRKYPLPKCMEGSSLKTPLPRGRSNSSPQRALSPWERGDRLRWVRVMIASN